MNLIKTAMLLAAMTALFMAVGYAVGGQSGMMIAFAVAAAINFFSYWNADKMVLRMHRAVEVDERNAPEFHEIVRRLAESAGMPMPRTYVIDSPQPNAFATGRNPQNAAVAATTGLLEQLSAEEVAGVMAHELAHIANRDTLVMTVTATLAGAISMLGNFAFFLGGSRNGNNNPLGGIGTLLAILVAPFAAMIVQMAISRTREYSADRLGAEICGRPLWLASALARIAQAAGHTPNMLAERNPATAHMFIINPLGAHARDSLFSTHPDTANRIAALQELDRRMQPGDAPQTLPRRQPDPPARPDPRPSAEAGQGPWGPPTRGETGGEAEPPRETGRWGRQGSDEDRGEETGRRGPWK